MPNRLIYGFCFHPQFEQNGYVYLHTKGPRRGDGSKDKFCQVTRWTLNRKTNRIDPDSHLVILQWDSNGHDGGGLVFGNDGMLYVIDRVKKARSTDFVYDSYVYENLPPGIELENDMSGYTIASMGEDLD